MVILQSHQEDLRVSKAIEKDSAGWKPKISLSPPEKQRVLTLGFLNSEAGCKKRKAFGLLSTDPTKECKGLGMPRTGHLIYN
jgi:hypothetical protein